MQKDEKAASLQADSIRQLAFPWAAETSVEPERIEIQSRRYLGGKSRLLSFLRRIVSERCGEYDSFADLFAGTGVVGHSFNRPDAKIIANDYLACNYVSLSCWLGVQSLSEADAAGLIAHLDQLPADEENYVSEQYGDRYFSRESARKIGVVRDEIDRLDLPENYRALALTSLLYAMDRVARTVGHYDAYRQSARMDDAGRNRPLRLPLPRVDPERNRRNEIYKEDANDLAKKIDADVVYLDPPYNSRQYSDTYHVLENIVLNDKPELIGVARKRPGHPDRSRYCGKDAAVALGELVESLSCSRILFSYNNMSDGDKRSNAILSEAEILEILGRRGAVEVFKTSFNSFASKRDKIPGHEERVYLCRVGKPRSIFVLSDEKPTPAFAEENPPSAFISPESGSQPDDANPDREVTP